MHYSCWLPLWFRSPCCDASYWQQLSSITALGGCVAAVLAIYQRYKQCKCCTMLYATCGCHCLQLALLKGGCYQGFHRAWLLALLLLPRSCPLLTALLVLQQATC